MAEIKFSKDYVSLIEKARENGDTFLVAKLKREMQDELYLQDEDLQKAAGKRVAELMNQKSSGMGKKV